MALLNVEFFKKRIPTIIGLLILFIGGTAGVFLVGRQTNFLPRASAEHAPKNLKITNISDKSFTVSWITDQATTGFIKHGNTSSLTTTLADERDQLTGGNGSYLVHYVTARGLSPGQKYFFKVGSGPGSSLYDDGGQAFEATTGPNIGAPQGSDIISGTVVTSAQTPAEGSIVYINLPQAAPLSAQVRASGSWAATISQSRTTNLSSYLNFSDSDIVSFQIIGPQGQTTAGTAPISKLNPAPPIILGQNFDLTDSIGASSTSLGDTSETEEPADSQFALDPLENGSTQTAPAVSLDNPTFDGEELNSTQPEFIGTAEPGSTINITVESETIYQDQIIVGQDGSFSWTPPDDLEPGEHTITITTNDQILTRTFIIAAPGDSQLPALTSSPSGETTSTSSPSAESSGSARVSQPSTSSGVPIAGVLTPTITLFTMGIGLILAGMLLSRKMTI